MNRQRRGCDLNPGPSAPESSTLTTRLPSRPPSSLPLELQAVYSCLVFSQQSFLFFTGLARDGVLDCRCVDDTSTERAVTGLSLRSTQPCIPPGSLNRVLASAGVRAGMSPLPGGR